MPEHLSNQVRHWLDTLTFLCAGVAAVSLAQAALVLTIISTLIAIVLGGFRIHDRLKYGPARKD